MTDVYEILDAAGPGVSEGGLSDIEIDNIEKVVGVKIPSDIRKFLSVLAFSYMPFVCREEDDEYLPVPYFYDLHNYEISIKQMCENLNSDSDSDSDSDDDFEIISPPEVKASLFSRKRIYLGHNDTSGIWFIDLDPSEGGVVGQAVFLDFLDEVFELTHKNFSELLTDIVRCLQLRRNDN
jgi:hypothetical protein